MIENQCAALSPANRHIETRLPDGTLASGHFTFLSAFDYSLEMDSPCSGYRTGRHIPFFAGGSCRWWSKEGGITEDCRKSAELLLEEEYNRCVECLVEEAFSTMDIHLSYDLARQLLSRKRWQERIRAFEGVGPDPAAGAAAPQ